MSRDKIFICYSHDDAKWLELVKKHLKPASLSGLDIWSDERILPGSLWQDEIAQALSQAKVAIVLVSPDFIGSAFITTVELPALLLAQKTDGVTVIPILVRPVEEERLEKLDLTKFQFAGGINLALIERKDAEVDRVLNDVLKATETAFRRP